MTNIRFEFWSFSISSKINPSKVDPAAKNEDDREGGRDCAASCQRKITKVFQAEPGNPLAVPKVRERFGKCRISHRQNTWSKVGLLFESWNKTLAVSDTPIANRPQHSINVRFVLKQLSAKGNDNQEMDISARSVKKWEWVQIWSEKEKWQQSRGKIEKSEK